MRKKPAAPEIAMAEPVDLTDQKTFEKAARRPRARRPKQTPVDAQKTQPADDMPAPEAMPQDSGYFVADDGLCFTARRWNEKDKRFDYETSWICGPIKVLFRARNLDGTGWRLVLEIVDRDGARREITIMDAEIGGQDWFRALADAGLKINPKKRPDLAYYLLIESDAAPRAWAVEKTGWTRDSYVLPHCTIGASAQPILFQGQDRTTAYGEAGTAEEWREHVGKACIGNSRMILAVTAAFASTLLPFSGIADSAGLGFHGNSSFGKTTALAAGASIFGPPAAYISTWRSTGNAVEGVAAKHNHGLLCLDEIREANEKEIGTIVMMLANGTGKGRMKDTAVMRERLTWQLIWLSTGEHALAHYMEAAGLKPDAGMMVRQLDIPADAGRGMGLFADLHGAADARTFAETLRHHCDTYHGSIGIAWLEHVVAHLEELKRDLPGEVAAMVKAIQPAGAESQVLRALRRFALLAVAGEYATQWGLTGWPAGEAIAGIKTCAAAWLHQRGGAENLEERRQVERLREFLSRHSSSRFAPWDRVGDDRAPGKNDVVGLTRAIEVQRDDGQGTTICTEFFITPEGWSEIYKGMDPAAAAHTLAGKGMLMTDKAGKPYVREYLPGMGRRRCYRPVATFFQMGEE